MIRYNIIMMLIIYVNVMYNICVLHVNISVFDSVQSERYRIPHIHTVCVIVKRVKHSLYSSTRLCCHFNRDVNEAKVS